jgi:hypothetical protein
MGISPPASMIARTEGDSGGKVNAQVEAGDAEGID